MNDTIVLGRDAVGVVAESDGMTYYLTECCGASAKGLSDCIGCRACYAEIDPALGDVPDKTCRFVDGELSFEDRPLALTEVYGDGIPYDQWVATIPGLAEKQAGQRAERERSYAEFRARA